MSAGQHTLELTSVSGGVESERSRQLRVIVEGATSTVGLSPLEQSAQVQSTICSSEPSTDCYGVRVIASDLGKVTALTSMPDGRVTFIENGQQVRVIAPDALSTAIALPAEGDRRLTGLTLDPNFEESHFVFVAWTELVNGVASLNLTRYREVGNILGEPATIATALPIAPDVATPLAMDDERLVYIAMPAARSDSVRRSLSEAGVVLRVDRDGRVPTSNQYGSPIVAEGYPLPLGLAIDRSTDTLWLSGRDRDQLGKVATIGIPTVRRGSWPSRPFAVGIQPAESGDVVESIAVVSQHETVNSPTRLLIATGGRVRSVVLTLEGTIRNVSDIPLGNGYYSHSVAADRNGFLYVGVETREGSASLLKLTALTR